MTPRVFRGGLALLLALASIAVSARAASSENFESKPPLLRWYQWRTVTAYKKGPQTNSLWDKAATGALDAFSHMAIAREEQAANYYKGVMREHLQKAVGAGCTDPLIRYLQLEYAPDQFEHSPDKVIAAWVQVANQIDKTKYATPLKFYPNLRAWKVWVAYNRDVNHPPPQYRDVLLCWGQANKYALKIVKETNDPIEVVSDVCEQVLEIFGGDKGNGEKTFYDSVKNDLARNWPEDARVSLLRGIFYLDYAWQGRGTGYAGSVTEENQQLFRERLSVAEDSLQKAWRLDPTLQKIPLKMLSLELGQGQGRNRMELWFQRAMALNTNNYQACGAKLFYLLPQWYGSAKDMIEFGRECVASTNWGPAVPWTLIHAHENLATYTVRTAEEKKKYWQNPLVWADVKLVCEKNLITDPHGSNSARHTYVRQALRCEQWDEVIKQLRLLTSTNYDYFGVPAEFDRMARTAAEKARPQ